MTEEQLEMKLAEMKLKTQSQLEEMQLAAQKRVLELVEEKAAWETLAAHQAAMKAEHEKLASLQIHDDLKRQSKGAFRPSNIMRPRIEQEGGEWVATYSEVVGRGPTPDIACQEFDRIWLGKDEV